MDRNYLDRITLRKSIMAQHPDNVLAGDESARAAVHEFYIWLVGTYLPTRYPRMFQLVQTGKGEFTHLHNLPADESIPLSPPDHPIDTLMVLGGLVEDDFLFLLPSDDGDGYTLKAFVTCFPNGFNTASKFNLKLRDIHKPVPHYKEKLETSMDRYFAKLKVGKFVKRANVSAPFLSRKRNALTGLVSGQFNLATNYSDQWEIICMRARRFPWKILILTL